jgi:AcrR family transcriptional regulator
MSNKREIQKQQTKDRILQSALTVYSKQGFVNTTMAQIAQEANVAKGSLFLHFSSQDQLIQAVIQRMCADFSNRLYAQKQNCSADVHAILQLHLSLLQDYEDLYRHIIIERTMLSTEAQHIFLTLQSTLSNTICQIAERDIKANKIKAVAPHLFFNTWIGLLHYYLTHRDLFSPNSSVIADHQQTLLMHYLHLIDQNRSCE